jgi:hypothetical protein
VLGQLLLRQPEPFSKFLHAMAQGCPEIVHGQQSSRASPLQKNGRSSDIYLEEQQGMFHKQMLKILTAAFGLLAVGCASLGPRFYVDVSALSDPQLPKQRTYVVDPGLQGVDPTDLQFREFATQLDRVLRSKGFAPAAADARPDLLILLSYGIGEPQMSYYSYPVFGRISGGTSTFTASTFGSGGGTRTTGTITSPTRHGVVGTRTGTRREFTRWAAVEAVDVEAFVKTQRVVQAWRTTMTSSGSSGDLRRVVPVMLAAGQPYIGTNTRQQVRRVLNDESPEVVAIR